MKFNIKHIVYFILLILLALPLYLFIVFDSFNKYNLTNFLLYMISFSFILLSGSSIIKNNIKSYNIFAFFFFTALFFNTFNISTKQLLKEPIDLYVYILGPIILMSFPFLFEHIKVKKVKFTYKLKIDFNLIYILFLVIYIICKLYIGMKVGFRITDYGNALLSEGGGKYTVAGFSGLSVLMQWLLIIFIPYVKNRYRVIAIFFLIIFSGILMVNRGDIIKILLFITLYWIYLKIQSKALNLKTISYLIIGFLIIIYSFGAVGDIRQESKGYVENAIIGLLGSRIESSSISWVYAYLSFNFEALKLYYSISHEYEMNRIMEVFDSSLASERSSIARVITISGFNASTFMGAFVLDYGNFFYLEVLILSMLVGLIVLIAKKLDFLGLYIFIATLMSLMIFGDHLMDRYMLVSILLSIIIFPLIKNNKNRVI